MQYHCTNLLIEQKNGLRKSMRFSLYVHTGGLLLFSLWSFIFPTDSLLLQPVVQIDIVALPDFAKNKYKLVDVSKAVKEEVKPTVKKPPPPKVDTMTLKKDPKKRTKPLDPMAALKRLKREMRRKEKATARKRLAKEKKDLKAFESKYRKALKGNNLNTGATVTGALAATAQAYANHVIDKIRQHWELPPHLADAGYRASISLYVDVNGKARYNFLTRSGNAVFDNMVQSAVESSIPFAPPPAELVNKLKRRYIEVAFPL